MIELNGTRISAHAIQRVLLLGFRPLHNRKVNLMTNTNKLTAKQHAAKINTALAGIVKSKDAMHQSMINASFYALEHAAIYGNTTPMLNVSKAINEAMGKKYIVALNKWIAEFSPIRVVLKTETHGMLTKKAKAYRPFDIDAAEGRTFLEFMDDTNGKRVKYFKRSTFLKFALESVNNRLSSAMADEDTVLVGDLADFEATVKEFNALFGDAALSALVREEDAFIAADKVERAKAEDVAA